MGRDADVGELAREPRHERVRLDLLPRVRRVCAVVLPLAASDVLGAGAPEEQARGADDAREGLGRRGVGRAACAHGCEGARARGRLGLGEGKPRCDKHRPRRTPRPVFWQTRATRRRGAEAQTRAPARVSARAADDMFGLGQLRSPTWHVPMPFVTGEDRPDAALWREHLANRHRMGRSFALGASGTCRGPPSTGRSEWR